MGRYEPSARSILRVVAILVAVALVLYLIVLLRKPIGWLAMATFIALAMSGPVNRLSRWLPRGLAIACAYLVLILVPVGLGALVVPPIVNEVTQLAGDVPGYSDDITKWVNGNRTLRSLDAKYDITGEIQKQAATLPTRIGDAASILGNVGLGVVNSVFALVNILILSVFMVAGGRRWIDALLLLRPEPERERLARIFQSTAQAVGGYVQGALTIAFIAGIQTYVMLTILGVPFRAPLAVLAGFASLIPLVGATVAALIIGVVTLFTHFPTATIIWAVWAIVYQQIENNIIQPQVQRRTVNVAPFIVLVAVLFGSTLLGIVGALVAIPLAATIQIMLREWWDWREELRLARIVDPQTPEPVNHHDDEPPPASGVIVPTH